MEDSCENADYFGFALAVGDFDGDGYDDLAIDVPGEDGAVNDQGVINVLYGSNSGLTAAGDQLWHQDSAYVEGTAELSDHFGKSLAAGDFDGDGYDDLAVGVPDEDVSGFADAGAVNVLYGTASGLSASGDQMWHQDSSGGQDSLEGDDKFGASLATGDFDGDGYTDLAVGVPTENLGALDVNQGVVNVLYGSAGGLSGTGAQLWHQNVLGVKGVAEANDRFGHALAAGDFDGDAFDDLAIGVPYEEVNGQNEAGAVNVLYGTASGPSASGDQMWYQDVTDISGVCEPSDRFGYALATGDFDQSGQADLAVGVPYEHLGVFVDAGMVNVICGSPAGLSVAGNQGWHQNVSHVNDTAEGDDRFGFSLAAGGMRYPLFVPEVLKQ